MIDLQQRLSSSLADLQAAHHQVSVLENKAHSLEVEKTLAANAEQRLTAEVSQVPLQCQKGPKMLLFRTRFHCSQTFHEDSSSFGMCSFRSV